MRRRILATTIATSLVLISCGGSESATDTTVAESAAETTEAPKPAAKTAAECAADAGTVTDGVLTMATGEPSFPPYVIDDKPEAGEGFEAAVAAAVARELGFEGDKVKWIRTSFDGAIAPGPKDFDINLQQYTITDERAKVVDFSKGYYTASQAVFGYDDSAAANAKTLADLSSLKIGVAAGTTSVTYVEDVIKPADTKVFNDNAAAKAALDAKQIDAIVSDLPTALYVTAVEIEGSKVFGQIDGSGTDQFGMLLPKDSPLTPCVDKALGTLEVTGELAKITSKWMSDYTEAPVITK